MPDSLPRVQVKVQVKGSGPGSTKCSIDGVDVSMLLLVEPFEIRFPTEESPEAVLVVGIPVSELDVDLTDAVVQAIAIDDLTGEVA